MRLRGKKKSGKKIIHGKIQKRAEIFGEKEKTMSNLWAVPGISAEVRNVPVMFQGAGSEGRNSWSYQGFMVKERMKNELKRSHR